MFTIAPTFLCRLRPLRALMLSGCAVLPLLASGAQGAPLRTPLKAEKTYATPLDAATGERAVRTLDSRTPALELRFDLSQADVINRVALTLSADPLPGVDPSLPLLVQFNNGKPVPLKTRGRGFDATVALEPSRARATGNVLRLSHAVPCGAGGGYALNLDQSSLRIDARPKSRRLQLREVESRLSASAFAPASVGLVASGDMAPRLHALGAQAVGLRMERIPDFRLGVTDTDFDLVMVRSDQLHRYTDEADILAGTGPRAALSRAHPERLFLTGDTDAQVLQTVQAFATHFLPRSRRSETTPGEIGVQSPLDYARTQVSGDVRLDALSVTTGALREYTFDVPDPAATAGSLVLRLTRDDTTAPGARLAAVLNGESLGEARMDARRKTVSYPIRPGQLRGTANRLELTTKAAADADACAGGSPFIAIGAGSRLRLEALRPSAPTDLSRFAADGSVMGADRGARTEVVLPRGEADYRAALRVVARLGKASGQGWTQAAVSRGDARASHRHTLLIEPFGDIEPRFAALAPRGLQSAWRGQPTDGSNRLASVERFAALDADEAVRLAARTLRASGRVEAGGVAALFPGADGYLVGVVSNTPGQSFRSGIAPLAEDAHWNGLSGGVSRWNARAVVMAQAALPAPGVAASPPPSQGPGPLQWLADFDLRAPDWSLPALPDLPQVELPDVGAWLEGLRPDARPAPEPQARPDMPERPAQATADVPVQAPVKPVPVPALKPVRVADAAPAAPAAPAATAPSLGLRGTIDLSDRRHAARQASGVSLEGTVRKARRLQRDLRSALRRWEVKASRLRADLRRDTGLRAPNLGGLRMGGYQLSPGIVLLGLAALLTLIGLAFVSSTSRNGSHH